MIVTCPECRTRYRYPQEDPTGPVRCMCSRCESTFVAGDVARSYLVMREPDEARPPSPPVPATAGPDGEAPVEPAATPVVPGGAIEEPPAGLSIGMDDPSLASRLQQTALDGGEKGGPETALTYHIEVDEPEPEAEAIDETDEEPETDGELAARKRPGFGAFAFVTLLGAACAAGGWQLALYLGQNPPTVISSTTPSWGWQLAGQLAMNPSNLAAASGVVGLLVGWLWVRWKFSRS